MTDPLDPEVCAIRQQLPRSLLLWRNPEDETIRENDIYWELLRPVFTQQGFVLWEKRSGIRAFDVPDVGNLVQNGWEFSSPVRDANAAAGGVAALVIFQPITNLCRAASGRDGQCVVIRILKMGDEGQQQLDILRRMCRGAHSLMGANHAIPLIREIEFADITFGVFPFVGFPVHDAYQGFAENSVGDIVDMIVQMLEALSYIHKHRIAHLDAYKENFMVQFHPESLRAGKVAAARPRVVLIDFESAVQFPADTPVSEQVVTGPPRGIWPTYGRKCPPEVYTGEPYDPYKVDVWQLGCSLLTFRTTVSKIDELLDSLVNPLPDRLSASAYLDRLRDVVNDIPPNVLLVPPVVLDPYAAESAGVVTN